MGEKLVYDGRIIDLDSLSKEELEELEKKLMSKEDELVEKLNKKLHIEDDNER